MGEPGKKNQLNMKSATTEVVCTNVNVKSK